MRFALPHAERKPKDYRAEAPLDTLDVKLTSWFGFKSRLWRHGKPVECGGGLPERQRQKCQLIERTPFEVKAIQVAGGRAGFAGAAGGGWPSLRPPVRNWASDGRALPDAAPLTAEGGWQVERTHGSHLQEESPAATTTTGEPRPKAARLRR